MASLIFEIGAVIMVATLLAYATRLFRQPMILGYIIAGFALGPYIAGVIKSIETITLLSELGIAFVLFVVGIEIDIKKLRDSGKKAAVMGMGQVIFTAAIGYFLASSLGFAAIESFYLAVALTMSSTMIVIKLLSDKGTLDTLSGRLILGMLLIQDVMAIFILALLPTLGHSSAEAILLSAAKGVALIAAAAIAGRLLVPAIFQYAARSTELLFLTAVSWLFAFAFFADYLGYSIAIGAFAAGVTLASSTFRLEILSKVKSLRDFFATIFFVSLGMQLALPSLGSIIIPAIVLSLFVLVGNPLIVAVTGMMLGYNKRISIMTGLPIGQISEFSLIVIALGVSLGHIDRTISSLTVLIAAITITATTYAIKYDEHIYGFMQKMIRFKAADREKKVSRKKVDVVLCGYNRIGFGIAKKLKELGKSFIVVDFDPDVVAKLKKEKIPVVYGDVGDYEFLKTLRLGEAELVVSTVPGLHDNEMIIKEAGKGQALAVVTSNHIDGALKLYDYGASYVILPHFIGGEHMALLLEKFNSLPTLIQHKFSHIKELHQRRLMGYDHLI